MTSFLSFQPASCLYPDLITDECPLGCDDCEEIYVNEQTGHRIICRCNKCGHKKDCEALGSVEGPLANAAVSSSQESLK
jgi:hypothetical protein